MKKIIITLLALVTLGGVASADRHPPTVRDHRSGGVYVQNARPRYYQPRQQTYRYERPAYRYNRSYTYSRPYVHVIRRPIYVQRPVIRYRYYNYYQRPAVVVENYAPMAGYYWVPGQWMWSGYEWVWQPGHYEPDTSYDSSYYDQPTYDGTYYNNGYDGSYYNNGY